MSDNGRGARAGGPRRGPRIVPMQKLFDHLDPALLARLRLCLELTRALRARLPEPLAAHCWCSRLEDATLTVTVDDAARATSLVHCHQRELLKHLNAEFAARLPRSLRRLQVHVAAHRSEADGLVRPD